MNEIITSRDNTTIKDIVRLLSGAKYRKKAGQFVCEGVRLCRDGVDSGQKPKIFLYTNEAKEKYSTDFEKIFSNSVRSFEVKKAIFDGISDTVSPQGFLCVFEMLDKKGLLDTISNQGLYVALENIQDPANIGTILRTAEAFGIDGVILSGNCCDIYSPKSLRGSMGAVFRIPIAVLEPFDEGIKKLTAAGVHTYASTPHNAKDIRMVDFSQGGVVLIGNEGNGLTDSAAQACEMRITIPMNGRAESLNAATAAAILIWKLQGG